MKEWKKSYAFSKVTDALELALTQARAEGFQEGRAFEAKSHCAPTSIHPMQQGAPGMSAYLNKEDYENARYVKTPWGLLDRYAQLFVAT
jgi:hypothetical protein